MQARAQGRLNSLFLFVKYTHTLEIEADLLPAIKTNLKNMSELKTYLSW